MLPCFIDSAEQRLHSHSTSTEHVRRVGKALRFRQHPQLRRAREKIPAHGRQHGGKLPDHALMEKDTPKGLEEINASPLTGERFRRPPLYPAELVARRGLKFLQSRPDGIIFKCLHDRGSAPRP